MEVQNVNFSSPAFNRDPFPTYAKMREMGPVIRTKMPMVGRCWITTTYEAANAVLRDKDAFVTDSRNAGVAKLPFFKWWTPRMVKVLMKNMLTMDEPDHRRLRNLMESAFLRQSVEEMRPRIATLVQLQLDELEWAAHKNGAADLKTHFAHPLPLAVICELLGLPDQDRDKFTRWANFGGMTGNPLSLLRVFGGIRKLMNYLKLKFAEYRKQPAPGLLSALVQVEQDGDRLSEDELMAGALMLLLAGHETTVHLLDNAVLTLTQHPEAKAELVADWTKVDSAIDEILRYTSPIQTTKPRYARRDMEFFGQDIKQGEFFMPQLGAANCDPAEFPDPERFDINRSPNRHLGFGAGIHVCLGLKLAKAEVEIALKGLFTRFPDLDLAVPVHDIQWQRRIGIHAPTALPLWLPKAGQKPHRNAA